MFLPVLAVDRARGIRLRLPLLNSRNNSKSSLREDPEAGRGTGFPGSHESLALGELLSLPEHEPPRLTAAATAEDQCNLLSSDPLVPSSGPAAPRRAAPGSLLSPTAAAQSRHLRVQLQPDQQPLARELSQHAPRIFSGRHRGHAARKDPEAHQTRHG